MLLRSFLGFIVAGYGYHALSSSTELQAPLEAKVYFFLITYSTVAPRVVQSKTHV